jgi:hypothetical protein
MYTTDYGGTMTTADDNLALLAAANPVPELPTAEPPERLRRLIEEEGHAVSGAYLNTPAASLSEAEGHAVGGAQRHTPARRLMRPLVAVSAALAAATIGLVLSNGASSPGLNIAAAAYAATSSGGGVLEARFVDRMFLSGHRVFADIDNHREWIDASAGMRRERRTVPGLLRHLGRVPHAVYELASSPDWIETWSSAPSERNVILRVRSPAGRVPAGVPQPTPSGGATQTPAGIETYRRLYRDGTIRLVGRERRDGRLLWKLEGDVAFGFHSLHAHGKPFAFHPSPGKLVPIMAVVVLVDPRTYLPVVQRTVLLLSGHRRQVQQESELLGYRHLPGGAASEALLKLSAQHPHARVVTKLRPLDHYIRERVVL